MARPSTANRDWFRTTALLVLGGGVSVHVTRMVFGTAWLPPLAPELAFLVLAVLVLLVDASHPDQWVYAPPEFRASAQPSAAMGLAYRAAQRLGVARLANLFPIPADCGHPAPYCAEERAYRNARFMDIYVAEMGAPERDAQVRAVASLGDRPLIVLTASDHSDQGLPPQAVAQFERDSVLAATRRLRLSDRRPTGGRRPIWEKVPTWSCPGRADRP